MASQNYMDKLILEASARLEEKFQAARDGLTVNVASYSGSDRTYNLKTQLQHIPQLQQDKHFMQMVNDVDKYTSPEWTLRGDVEKRLYSLLAGLLKGLLRECISSNDAAVRKINIEKCWNWYKDKKKGLLEWKIERRGAANGEGKQMPKISKKGDDAVEGSEGEFVKDDQMDEFDLTAKAGTMQRKLSLAVDAPGFDGLKFTLQKVKDRIEGPVLTLNYMHEEDDQQRATKIVKKLELYQKRNLQKSLDHRLHQAEQLLDVDGRRPATVGAAAHQEQMPGPRVVYREKAKADALKASPSLMHSVTAEQPAPQKWKQSQEFNDAMGNVQKIWVQKRAQEAETKLDDMEFADTVSMWSFNHARIEEEMNRRQEALQMSSQTGKTCHAGARRPVTAPPPDFDFVDTFQPSSLPKDLKKTQFEDSGHRRHSSSNASRAISLSPYDNFNAEKEGTAMRLLAKAPPATIVTPDAENEARMRGKGLLQTHPTAIRGTSVLNAKLDVIPSIHTAFAPSMLVAIGQRPGFTTAADGEEAAETSTKKKGEKGTAGKEAKGAKKGAAKRKGPVDPQLLDQIFPVLPVEQEVPSIMRTKQMQQVEAVREAFARCGMNVPTSAIELGILTPEDRPYIECMSNLPPPEFGLVPDFTKKSEKVKVKAAKPRVAKAAK